MTSALQKFDPAEHVGNLYDAFVEFIEAFAYEYEAIAKQPPAGTADTAAWFEQDKRKQLLGRYASRNMQKDFENETTQAERTTITYTDTVTKLKARYKPTQNTTLANYNFHRMRQGDIESYDMFVNRVKDEAASCNFKCGDACTVADTLIRDQIVIGTTDDEIRAKALSEQWGLTDLVTKGRQMEAASLGADKIKEEMKQEVCVSRLKPGKYSRKSQKGASVPQCKNCSNKACKGGKTCIAFGKDCFLCGGKGHYRGAPNCKGKKKKPGKGRDGARRVAENSSSDSSDESSGEEEEEVKRVGAANVIHPAKFVSHIRRTSRRTKRKQQKTRY